MKKDSPPKEPARTTFESRVEAVLEDLAPAEQRMARFFIGNKQAVLLNSAAEIAQAAGSSDATGVRAARALGFGGLSGLREGLLADLTGMPSPGKRLARTLEETGDDAVRALQHVIARHEDVLDVLKRPDVSESFTRGTEISGRLSTSST